MHVYTYILHVMYRSRPPPLGRRHLALVALGLRVPGDHLPIIIIISITISISIISTIIIVIIIISSSSSLITGMIQTTKHNLISSISTIITIV